MGNRERYRSPNHVEVRSDAVRGMLWNLEGRTPVSVGLGEPAGAMDHAVLKPDARQAGVRQFQESVPVPGGRGGPYSR